MIAVLSRAFVALSLLCILGQSVASRAQVDTAARGIAIQAKKATASNSRLYPNTITVAAYGDSRMAQFWPSATQESIRGVGYWLGVLSNQRYRSPYVNNYGVSGETSAQFLARISAVIADPSQVVIMPDPTNDYSAIATATTIANMRTIFQTLVANGKIVIAWYPTPRSGANVLTSTGLKHQSNYGAWLLQNAAALGVYTINATPSLYAPAAAASGFADASNMLADGLHPNINGAYTIASYEITVLDKIFGRTTDAAPFNNADAYDATDAPMGNLVSNPLMIGTGGTVSAGGATVTSCATSGVASGWALIVTNGTGLTVMCSLVTGNGGNYQQIAVTGTATAGAPLIQFRQVPSTSLIAENDVLTSRCSFQVDANSAGVIGFGLQQWITDAGSAHAQKSGEVSPGFGTLPAAALSGVNKTDPNVVGASPTEFYLMQVAAGAISVPMTLTERIGFCEIRKISA